MRRLINGVAVGLLAVLLLVAGLLISRVIWLQLQGHRKDMPHGWFHGYLQLRINNIASGASNDVPTFYMVVKGRTQPHWHWRTPTNFSYSRIEFDFGRNPASDLVKLELPSLAYLRGNDSGTLTSELLARWIAEDNAQESNSQLEQETAWIIEFFQRACEGAAPGPRHSGLLIEDGSFGMPPGVSATLYHWRLGGGIWWLDVAVLVGTMAGVWWFVRRRCRTIKAPGTEPA